uniref:Uncharacterized protein n=1 Tax=Oryza rufipogon TaxID=4529 RepID=A0A0E0QPW6_ORYRU
MAVELAATATGGGTGRRVGSARKETAWAAAVRPGEGGRGSAPKRRDPGAVEPAAASRAWRLGALPRRREDPKWWSSATVSGPLMVGSSVPAGVQAKVVGVRMEEAGGMRGRGRRRVGKAAATVALGPVMDGRFRRPLARSAACDDGELPRARWGPVWPRRHGNGYGRLATAVVAGPRRRADSGSHRLHPPAVAVAMVAAVQRSVGAHGDVGLPNFDGRIYGRLGQILSVQQRMPAGWQHGGLASLPKLWVVG